jgi:diadenosine tetraphosphate (Ap4A) HIT family hydrolase
MHETGAFTLDPRIAASSHLLAQLPLCEARLQDDARFPWVVLVPRRGGLVELSDLAEAERLQLAAETMWAGAAVKAMATALGGPVFKLNHGQLGNVVAQLHVHVVGRRADDAAWPGPVWGVGTAKPYSAEALSAALGVAAALPRPQGRVI